jgi:hypothetical protein
MPAAGGVHGAAQGRESEENDDACARFHASLDDFFSPPVYAVWALPNLRPEKGSLPAWASREAEFGPQSNT